MKGLPTNILDLKKTGGKVWLCKEKLKARSQEWKTQHSALVAGKFKNEFISYTPTLPLKEKLQFFASLNKRKDVA